MRTALVTVAETAPFVAKAKRLLSDDERHALIEMIASDPECGALIQGTGGVRKVRFAVGGKGKRGGVRVVYFFHNNTMPVYLFAIFAKSQRENLTRNEQNILAATAREIVKENERRK